MKFSEIMNDQTFECLCEEPVSADEEVELNYTFYCFGDYKWADKTLKMINDHNWEGFQKELKKKSNTVFFGEFECKKLGNTCYVQLVETGDVVGTVEIKQEYFDKFSIVEYEAG